MAKQGDPSPSFAAYAAVVFLVFAITWLTLVFVGPALRDAAASNLYAPAPPLHSAQP